MKNLDSQKQSLLKNTSLLFLMVSVLFIMPGCEKSDILPHPANSEINTKEISMQNEPGIMIMIDHVSVSGNGPDYKVMLYRSGKVIFIGRRNVSLPGTHSLEVNSSTVDFIRNMYLSSLFFHLPSADPTAKPPYYVETTFSDGYSTKTVRDFNNGSPQIVLQLRKKAEVLLGIGSFVDRNSRIDRPVVSE